MDFLEEDELYEHFRMEVDKGQDPVRIMTRPLSLRTSRWKWSMRMMN